MELAYTVWNWMFFNFSRDPQVKDWRNFSEFPKRDFEIACKTMADLGYKNIECFYFIAEHFEGCDDEFETLLKDYGLNFVCIYNYLTGDFEKDLTAAKKSVAFINRHGKEGKKYMNLESPKRPADRELTEEDYIRVSEQAEILGKMCHENGIELVLHPHNGTVIERRHEIDYFAAHTNPEYVNFCLDTAHTTICGMRPEELFVDYIDRLKYVHLKDVQPDPDNEELKYPQNRFRALGQGTIDFPTIIKYIKRGGYDGILCVELDNPRVNHYQSAQFTKQYLHYVLGMD